MTGMIVSDNRIKSRRYNLVIDGNVVEEFLSNRDANTFADEYRSEGFAVDKIEVFSVTKGMDIVGENCQQIREEVLPSKNLGTPAASIRKVEQDRAIMRARNAGKVNRSASAKATHHTSVGRERNSTLHAEYVANLKEHGFQVRNKVTDEVWFGFQVEIKDRLMQFVRSGGNLTDLDIKFLGKKG